jgi:glycylpeptide N-tetradecanoyltransferase
VVETPGSPGTLTDFVSFYTLPSTVMNHPTHTSIKAAYSFYNVSTATPWVELMQDALVLAKREDFDVFNALDLMENRCAVNRNHERNLFSSEFLEKLKFGIGDGNLQYYLYNWRCPKMEPTKIGKPKYVASWQL